MVAMRKPAGYGEKKSTKKRVGCEKKFTNKGAWSKQEDQKLIDYIQKHGEGCWSSLPQSAGLLRCGKSCRLRWVNYLKPDVKRGNFGEDEEDLIIKLHALLGNRWSLIAGRLPGRTDNEVKNYWNSHLKKKLMRMGIDPNNHRLGERASGTSKSFESRDQTSNPLISAADNNAVLDSTCGSASKTTSSLPDLNLNLNVGAPSVDEQMQLTGANSHKELEPAPFTTLLLFG
ncbi:hypothetical protein VitviT2T_025792 [Vitis vinifera]|uniref:Transcription repressor MYB6 n=3 Tax=Vitis vinifera TaxID=29760 RepID=A5C8M7_VITVI|nr:Transcription repressor MYB6 [Vitis vinifera]WKA08029.1 hypothetical protein VitviT2T_025792 [Vitis vinifera]CAN84079.1 hypothetical protein VITISV_005933 [Vitis vinifera]